MVTPNVPSLSVLVGDEGEGTPGRDGGLNSFSHRHVGTGCVGCYREATLAVGAMMQFDHLMHWVPSLDVAVAESAARGFRLGSAVGSGRGCTTRFGEAVT